MSITSKPRLVAALGALAASMLLLVGCASGGGSESSGDYARQDVAPQEYEGGAPQEEAPQDGAQAPGEESQGQSQDVPVADRAIITTTSTAIRVEDVPGTVGAVEQLVEKHDGRIESRNERTTNQVPEAALTIRVPAASNDAFIADLKELGEVQYVESSAEDVTLEQVDLESRIDSLEASIASLQTMLEEATDVDTMLNIERELTYRQGELQSLEAQLEVLNEDVAMSTVHLTLSTDEVPDPIDEPSGFWAGLVEGWHDFVESLGDFFTGFGYALPGLVLFLLILAAIWFFVVRPLVRRIRNRSARPGPNYATHPAAHPSAQPVPQPEHANRTPANDLPANDPRPDTDTHDGTDRD